MLHEQRKQLQPRGRQNEHDGLFTNRLLWLGDSAVAFFLWGSGCHNLALRAFMNKPWKDQEPTWRVGLYRCQPRCRSGWRGGCVSTSQLWRLKRILPFDLLNIPRSGSLRMLRQVRDLLLGAGVANGQGGSDFIASFLHQPCRKLCRACNPLLHFKRTIFEAASPAGTGIFHFPVRANVFGFKSSNVGCSSSTPRPSGEHTLVL